MCWKHLLAAAGIFVLNMKLAHVPSREIVEERCGGRPACTRFVSETLSIDCSGGAMRSGATAVALLYVLDTTHSRHELLHITDMRASVDSYLDELEARAHPSESACTDAAEKEKAAFNETMRRFAQQSMMRRH